MKKIICMGLFLLLSFSVLLSYAEADISVYVDGRQITFDQAPFIKDGRTLVPLRAIFEALGCCVSYDNDTRTVYADKGTAYTLSLTVGEKTLFKNGKTIEMDVPAMIVNSRTFVPLRAVAEALDTLVDWNGETRTVTVDNTMGYGVQTKYLEKDYVASDGTVLMTYLYGYPVLPNTENHLGIRRINEGYEKKAAEHQAAIEAEWLLEAETQYKQQIEAGQLWYPYTCEHVFDITFDAEGVLVVRESDYSFFSGAHPNTDTDVAIYRLPVGETLLLTDIVLVSEQKIYDRILEAFLAWCEEYAVGEEIKTEMTNKLKDVSYYLTKDSLVCYFDTYEVGPYAIGAPEISIPFAGNEALFQPWVFN